MLGFIHLLLEAYVSETIGTQYLGEIRRMAVIEGPALATERYPDQLTIQFIQAIAQYQGIHPDEVWYGFGAYFINAPLLERYYGAFVNNHSSAYSLLRSAANIHKMLGANLKGAVPPTLDYLDHSPDLLEIVYRSQRPLCRFLLGIIQGISLRFNQTLEVREMECQRHGAPSCRVLVRFLPVRHPGSSPGSPIQAGMPGSGPQTSSGPLPHHPFDVPPGSGPQGNGAAADARRLREQEEDLLILQTLAGGKPSQPATSGDGVTREPALDLALSLFEIAHRLTISGVSAAHTRLSLLQSSLTRLSLQGFIEYKVDPHVLQSSSSPEVMVLGGPGILAARRYRITIAGQVWLRERQRHRQGY